ncbi:AraC family transcriptional regulator, partial [Pseudomonas aeruginosa]|uniref:AraC family transcriptional regulator n=1 Tax=Pseudomonas aeruginosa TaxID=287 RepID=UPI0039686E62
MIDSTFSRATWLNSLHMSTLTLSLLEKEGFAREQLLEGSGITPADLLDLRRLISPWQEQQVFANACRLSDEPALGLRLGLRTRISAYGLLGYALLSAPTLGEALRIGLSYPVLLGTYFHLSLEVADGRAWLVATGYGEDEALRPFNTELCLGSLKVTCADLLGHALAGSGLRLCRRRGDGAGLRRGFRLRVALRTRAQMMVVIYIVARVKKL